MVTARLDLSAAREERSMGTNGSYWPVAPLASMGTEELRSPAPAGGRRAEPDPYLPVDLEAVYDRYQG
jgi:hypothetical protein